MELWIIISKFIVLMYLAFCYVNSTQTSIPLIVFSILAYLCLNIMIYIPILEPAKQIVMILSIILVIVFYRYVDPNFLLLLPMNLYELASIYIQGRWILFGIVLIPVLLIQAKMQSIYVLVALFSFSTFTAIKIYTNRLYKYEYHLDRMRKDIQRLTKSLNENKEYIKQSEYTFKLEERNRLSQEIHDKIGHSMTGALIQMEASKRLLDIDKEKASELLQNAINISKEGIESIRVTLKNMKPPIEQIGVHRIKLLIDEFSAKHGIKIYFLHKGDLDRISPLQWKVIYENLTEAMTNALKYSDATHIHVEIQVLNTILKVVVKDNGKGAIKIKKGLGIIGMEERTASINGTIIVDGSDGFTVTMLLPI